MVGPVAQWLEQRTHNTLASGSNPLRPIAALNELEKFGEPEQLFNFPEHLIEKYVPPETELFGITDRRDDGYARYTKIKGIVYPSQKEGFYYDTLHYILPVISKGKKAVACLGFERVGTELLVIQLQGSLGLKTKIKWDKLLLHTLCDWAFKSTPITLIRVLNSQHVPYWPRGSDGTLHGPINVYAGESYTERRERFHMRYDVLPRRMGFRGQGVGDKTLIKAHLQLEKDSTKYVYQFMSSDMYFEKYPI